MVDVRTAVRVHRRIAEAAVEEGTLTAGGARNVVVRRGRLAQLPHSLSLQLHITHSSNACVGDLLNHVAEAHLLEQLLHVLLRQGCVLMTPMQKESGYEHWKCCSA